MCSNPRIKAVTNIHKVMVLENNCFYIIVENSYFENNQQEIILVYIFAFLARV